LLKPGDTGFIGRMRILLKIPYTKGLSLYGRDWLFLTVSRHFEVRIHKFVHDKTIIWSKSADLLRSAIFEHFGGENIGSGSFDRLNAIIALSRIVLARFDCTLKSNN
jgi:hypothetical protein